MSVFQIVAECAHVTLNDPLYGRTMQLLGKGALVPADAPELKRLLEIGYVVEVGAEETGGLNADGVPSGALDVPVHPGITSTPVEVPEEQRQAAEQARADAAKVKADAEVEERRAAARAKLPEGGAMPDGRAGQSVWVEYLVGRGSRYEDVVSADKAELIDLAKRQS